MNKRNARSKKKIYNVQSRRTKLNLKGALAKKWKAVYPFHSRLEGSVGEVGKQWPGGFPEDQVPGGSDIFFVVVDAKPDEL